MADLRPSRPDADHANVVAQPVIAARMIAAGWCSDSTTNVSLPEVHRVVQTI